MVSYDEFGFAVESIAPKASAAHIPVREQFPEPDVEYMGGTSDGWEYRSVFAGTKLAYTYEMVKQFLREEGYADVPLPETVEDLKLFRRSACGQMQLFAERGYIHNPIKILFPPDYTKKPNTLILCVYNEQAEGHLLRFHNRR